MSWPRLPKLASVNEGASVEKRSSGDVSGRALAARDRSASPRCIGHMTRSRIQVLLVGFVLLSACGQSSATRVGDSRPQGAGKESVWCADVDRVRTRIDSVYREAPDDGVWQNSLRRDVGDGLKEITGVAPAEIRADLIAVGHSARFVETLMAARFDLEKGLSVHEGLVEPASHQPGRLIAWLRANCNE